MDFHVYFGTLQPVLDRLDALKALLTQQGATIVADFTALQAEVTKVTETEQAAVALIQGLSQQLKEAQAASAVQSPQIQAVIDALDAQTTALGQAVAANTPSA